MEFHQLRSFVAVAREGRLARAAELLFLSQPAVSMHVKALEEELGVALFLRNASGMRLTREGEALLGEAEATLEAARRLESKARSLRGVVEGVLRLGINTDPLFLRAPALLELLGVRHGALRVQVERSHSPQVAASLASDRLDAGFCYLEGGRGGLDGVLLARVNLAVVAGPGWAERASGLDWPDLLALPWVWVTRACAYHGLLGRVAELSGTSPARETIVDDEPTLRALVAAGAGLTLLREDEAEAARATGELCILRPAGQDGLGLDLHFAWSRKRSADPRVLAALDAVRSVWPGAE